jgi:hypothetical protein
VQRVRTHVVHVDRVGTGAGEQVDLAQDEASIMTSGADVEWLAEVPVEAVVQHTASAADGLG